MFERIYWYGSNLQQFEGGVATGMGLDERRGKVRNLATTSRWKEFERAAAVLGFIVPYKTFCRSQGAADLMRTLRHSPKGRTGVLVGCETDFIFPGDAACFIYNIAKFGGTVYYVDEVLNANEQGEKAYPVPPTPDDLACWLEFFGRQVDKFN